MMQQVTKLFVFKLNDCLQFIKWYQQCVIDKPKVQHNG